jgi:hypothetical protein
MVRTDSHMPGNASQSNLHCREAGASERPGGTQDSTKFAEVALRLCVPPVKKVAAHSLHCAPPMSDRCP